MGVRLPPLPLTVVRSLRPWPSGQAPAPHAGQAGSTPAGRSRESAKGRPPDFGSGDGGSNPSSRIRGGRGWSRRQALNLEALVRFQPPELDSTIRLGRQLTDHSRSDREMLRVRIPPEPSRWKPSWSSPECSPLCRSGGRGFKSRRGRSFQSPGAAGARPSLMRTDLPDRHRGLGLAGGPASFPAS